MRPRETKNRKLANDLMQHFRGKDPFEMLQMLTDDCVFHIGSARARGVVPWYGIHKGHDEIKAYLDKRQRYLVRHGDNCGFEGPRRSREEVAERGNGQGTDPVEKLLADGDTVVAIGHLTDHFRDGQEMHSSDFVLVFEFKDGKISKFQYFHDTEAVVQAWREKFPGGEYARS